MQNCWTRVSPPDFDPVFNYTSSSKESSTHFFRQERDQMGIDTTLVAALIAVELSAITRLATSLNTVKRLGRELLLDMQPEAIDKKLLQSPKWRLSTFKTLKYHILGSEEDELRQVLIRAGAVRSADAQGAETWGLLERVEDLLKGEYGNNANYDMCWLEPC